MKKITFPIAINASRETIWRVLWDDATYRQWTNVFSEGSYAESDWKEGSKILFLGPGGGGMYSVIHKMVPNEFMSFKHLGVMKDFKEQPMDEETKKWSGSFENYTLQDVGGATLLTAELDSTDEFASYFSETFPKAMAKVKEIAEDKS